MSSPLDLVSLANAKLWLGATTAVDDAITSVVISAVSQQILGYLGRASLLPRPYTEIRNPNRGHDTITLRQWPVTAVWWLTINGQAVAVSPVSTSSTSFQAGYVVEQVEAVPPGKPSAIFLRGVCAGWSKQSVVINYSAGYQVTAETQTIPNDGVYQVTAFQPYGYWASDALIEENYGAGALAAVSGTPVPGQYSVSAGVYSFNAADAGQVISISYGYIPYAIYEACMEWVGERLRYRLRIGTESKTLGGQETIQYAANAMPAYIKEILAPYRARFTPQ